MVTLIILLVLPIVAMLCIATDDEKITISSITEKLKEHSQFNFVFISFGICLDIIFFVILLLVAK